MFTKLQIVSRWIIFTIDICLSVIALLFAVILQKNFVLNHIDFLAFYKAVVLMIIVNSLVFYSVKTYAGIVRYTSAQDSFRILFAVVLSSLILFFVHALAIVVTGEHVISAVTIITYTLCNFLFLI